MTEQQTQSEVRRVMVPANVTLATAKLIEKLSDGKPGDVLTDDQLATCCGETTSVGGNGYNHLLSAIRYTLRTKGTNWFRVRGENAIKCGEPIETIDRAKSDVRGLRRRSRRVARQLSSVDISDLEDADRTRALTLQAQVGAITMMASDSLAKSLPANGSAPKLTKERLLDAFTE